MTDLPTPEDHDDIEVDVHAFLPEDVSLGDPDPDAEDLDQDEVDEVDDDEDEADAEADAEDEDVEADDDDEFEAEADDEGDDTEDEDDDTEDGDTDDAVGDVDDAGPTLPDWAIARPLELDPAETPAPTPSPVSGVEVIEPVPDDAVDTTALERIEGELADVDAALGAIDAGDLERSPLLRELLGPT